MITDRVPDGKCRAFGQVTAGALAWFVTETPASPPYHTYLVSCANVIADELSRQTKMDRRFIKNKNFHST